MITRIYQDIWKYCKPGKILVIYGARRVGKTTLINAFLSQYQGRVLLENGENKKLYPLFLNNDKDELLSRVQWYNLLVIDEAQDIPQIGLWLKTLVDHAPHLQIIVTWSSSFDLQQSIGEPLTGRKLTLTLYPLSQEELCLTYNNYQTKQQLNNYLIFGSYPDIVTAQTSREKIMLLDELVQSYLLKDILKLDSIKAPKALRDLLKLLAYQIGNEVSHTELAKIVWIDQKTVSRYINLLVQWFILCPLYPYSRNMRNTIGTKNKYYFWDLGLRNSLIWQFAWDVRNDWWALRENFVVIEMKKYNDYHDGYGNRYFWREYGGQEIDLILEKDEAYRCFECKRSDKKKASLPSSFQEQMKQYQLDYRVINPTNYLSLLTYSNE
jgi:predicted AAA+ superfamily ATPase